jgi:hypothetical protein
MVVLQNRLIYNNDSEKKDVRTSFEGVLELDAPLSLSSVQLKHTNRHDEDQEGGDNRECAYNTHSSNVVKLSPQETYPPRFLQIFSRGQKPW